MISQTLIASSFSERWVYCETSMSNCYNCLRIRSRVISDLFKEERIQNWLIFLWKRVGVELFFIIIMEESNIIILSLITKPKIWKILKRIPEFLQNFIRSLFIIYNYKEMSAENYVNHQLNSSKTKQAHQFSKANRFPKSAKKASQVIYTLPSTSSKRTTTFGYGSKIDLANKTSSPPPGSYNPPSDFQKRDLNNTTSIHQGREKVTFGSFILEALKRNREVPSPDKYNIQTLRKPIGGHIGERIKTDFDLKEKVFIPGPGSYKLNAVQIGNKGSYVLSSLRNVSSPRYFSGFSLDRSKLNNKQPLPQATYDIQEKHFGKYHVSKYKSVMSCSFSKSQRPGLDDKSKKNFPGFKYRRFSQFGA